jgi:hypothetical protein
VLALIICSVEIKAVLPEEHSGGWPVGVWLCDPVLGYPWLSGSRRRVDEDSCFRAVAALAHVVLAVVFTLVTPDIFVGLFVNMRPGPSSSWAESLTFELPPARFVSTPSQMSVAKCWLV